MNILGIACHYHDAGACLVRDGVVAAASQEERFTRQKHCSDFPVYSINDCLQQAGLTVFDIDAVAFYEKPYLKFARVITSHLRAWPWSLPHFVRTLPLWLQDRLIVPMLLSREIGFKKEVRFIPHHLSHAASAFLVSPFEKAAIITCDGVGEWATTAWGEGEGTAIRMREEIRFPHSLGLVYTAVTTHLGFAANSGEGKVMGLAAYGEPRYLDALRGMVAVREDGSFRVDPKYFSFETGGTMYRHALVRALGPARVPESDLDQRHFDIASSLQKFTEETLIAIARHVHRRTQAKNLCLAGGVFLNCVANHRLLEETPFENIYVQPAAGDSGGALGAASYVYHVYKNKPRVASLDRADLGPEYTAEQIRRQLLSRRVEFKELSDGDLLAFTARKLADDKIVGWVQGRMEFGPRALGYRSILASPCKPWMKDHLNSQVKKREGFRPYAPAVPEEDAAKYFELKAPSPFMLLSPRVRPEMREKIPSVTHVDGTARVQTVGRALQPRLWGLIRAFEKITGVPVLLNTSFNLRGEPIVCSPEDAIGCFQRTNMDVLVLGNCVVEKKAG